MDGESTCCCSEGLVQSHYPSPRARLNTKGAFASFFSFSGRVLESATGCTWTFMRGSASLVCAKNVCRKNIPVQGIWGGLVPSLEPKRQGCEDTRKEYIINERAEPVVAFSRPPPFRPFIGPLVALSLWESWSSHDSNDDD